MKNSLYQYNFQKRPEMLAFIPGNCNRILEVGCGDGSFSVQLKEQRNAEVWGVEIHKEVADIASKKLDKVICGNFVDHLNEIPKQYFDCIVFNDILEHFTDPFLILEKIKSLLVSNGYIVSSLPNFRYIGNLMEILIEKDFQYKDSGILDLTHYRFFTKKSIVRMFEDHGYTVLKSYGVNPTKSIKVKLFNLLFFNFFSDTPYIQIATLAQYKTY
jgi:2-polyprenyl-3-methyl-5-hydroxy-6-metoxy-1,4-benzoquinol methylase